VTEIAVAFDVPSLDAALALHRRLGDGPEIAKIGLQLFTAAGPAAVRELKRFDRRVFLDLKLHDIPNTVKGAAAEAAKLGADFLTVHAMGGEEMIAAAVEGVRAAGGSTAIVAVTLLTSLSPTALPPGFERPFPLHRRIADLLETTERAGAAGIVCSAADLEGVRVHHPAPFFAITPGIRPAGSEAHDQQRVASVADAVRLGASVIVLGRAITAAHDPATALTMCRAERDAAAAALRS